jgi:hypothetical protein
MSISRGSGRVAVLAMVLAGAGEVRAAESGDRIGSVVAARIELQRQIGDWLTNCLAVMGFA